MFAPRMKDIKMSGIRKMFDLAGENAIHLGLGEPDFQPPENAINALKKAVDDGCNKYGATPGMPGLRDAIVEKEKRYRKDLTRDNVVVTAGGTEALMASVFTFIDKGDEVLIPDPGFVLYGPQVRLAGGKPVRYPLFEENGFVPKIEDMRITGKTKAIIVNSPSNPTGSVIDEKTIKAIVDVAEEKNLLIFSDEVYDEIVYEGKHHSFMGKYDDLIYVNSFSKIYAMTGWRIGYVMAKEEYLREIAKMHYYTMACPPTPIQYAALEALKGSQDYVKKMVTEFKRRRDVIVDEINKIKGFRCLKPKGAFYAFPSFTFNISSEELAMRIAASNVIVTPGTAFGQNGEKHLRLSYANSLENIKKGVEIIGKVVEGLR
ncbi:MAG: pyridoxal phosphate-dependent aminotransferase [Thermoplasmatales archaeon]|nr:pyridoxal phosphate-dependent aminotransferase [Thermoplasmatales archaeon]